MRSSLLSRWVVRPTGSVSPASIAAIAIVSILIASACGGRTPLTGQGTDLDPGASGAGGIAGSGGAGGNSPPGGGTPTTGAGGTIGVGGSKGVGGAVGTGGTIGAGGSSGNGNGGSTGKGGASGGPTTDASGPPSPCAQPLRGDAFDPNEVYISGPINDILSPGVAHWSCPDSVSTGFGNNSSFGAGTGPTRVPRIRPTDGRLLYIAFSTTDGSFELRIHEFRCDSCPFPPDGGYPPNSVNNDPVLPTDCSIYDGLAPQFLVAPSGAVLYYCRASVSWRDFGGQLVFRETATDTPLHLGYANLALTKTAVYDLVTGKRTPIVGLPDRPNYVIRAEPPDKFRIAQLSEIANATDELWEVDSTGSAKLIGIYPAPPTEAPPVRSFRAALERSGALFQVGASPTVGGPDVIVRRDLTGKSEIVYSEATKPLLRLYTADPGFITGP